MKKIYILLFLLTTCVGAYANTTQTGSWRWRNSDGSETGATWKQAQNNSITLGSNKESFRLRVEVISLCSNSSVLNCSGLRDSLQFTTTSSVNNSWKNIGYDIANPFVIAGSDNYVTEGQATTAQLTGSSASFRAGKIAVSDTVLRGSSIPRGSSRSEYEWCLKTTDNLQPNTTYYFRLKGAVTSQQNGIYPYLFTSGTLPVKLLEFVAVRREDKVKIGWSTASEQGNLRFEVQRSADGQEWATIDHVKGKGNTSSVTEYTSMDNTPLNSTAYYRLQQFDVDGSHHFSKVIPVPASQSLGPALSVWPNPVTPSGIGFRIENRSSSLRDVSVTLINMEGKNIYKQLFGHLQPAVLYQLHSGGQVFKPGMYVLKLDSKGFSGYAKVSIQSPQ